ncbi:unnamed protein product [Vitrella brassicaformis CCMP3155]|uniref:Uncharacterized protein n=1 Tax=Vitrella brassicaformis (strain CCMP3155) TaxID=1169540 RepID=A0A0G4G5H4_VITBC|nr:unnamed protein product [Vitrella brassicaformis CCMP3155]|eukprot:CEM23817.1 unnamed protein product [Vitrella brassicaformis CCMP3155]
MPLLLIHHVGICFLCIIFYVISSLLQLPTSSLAASLLLAARHRHPHRHAQRRQNGAGGVPSAAQIYRWLAGKKGARGRDESNKPMRGKVVIVTNGHAGLGFDTAVSLARQGAHVVLGCPSHEEGQRATRRIKSIITRETPPPPKEDPSPPLPFLRPPRHPPCRAEYIYLDHASLPSARAFAGAFRSRFRRLDALICVNKPFRHREWCNRGEGGYVEHQVVPFALTGLLFPCLKRTGRSYEPSRVVWTTTNGQMFATDRLQDLLDVAHRCSLLGRAEHFASVFSALLSPDNELAAANSSPSPSPPLHSWEAFTRAKASNVAFSVEFNHRLRKLPLLVRLLSPTSTPLPPRMVAVTCNAGLGCHLLPSQLTKSDRFLSSLLVPCVKAGKHGVATLVRAVTHAHPARELGDYMGPSGWMALQLTGRAGRLEPAGVVKRDKWRGKVWRICERIGRVRLL